MLTYYSTNKRSPEINLEQALLLGQAQDWGLFLPTRIPPMSSDLLSCAHKLAYAELATRVLAPYTEGVFDPAELERICMDAYDFPVPVEEVDPQTAILRLDRGPTASFKDFAARFLGRALGQIVSRKKEQLLILTATSGDTGSAVANAFYGAKNIRVLVLFPEREVSTQQRKQMTTLGDNVSALAVRGKFDDCQALVKKAFADSKLSKLKLSSANSINIGRLLPQSVYYVYAASRLVDIASAEPVVFSVPCGNFGNLMGGLLAHKAGLPVACFVVATNENDEVVRFMQTGDYQPIEPSIACISNAMNVGHPSNLARLVDLFGGHLTESGELLQQPNMEALRRVLRCVSISDAACRQTIAQAYRQHELLLEPHGAVAWAGLSRVRESYPQFSQRVAICLETAHPAKFPEEVESLIDKAVPKPPALTGLADFVEEFDLIESDYAAFQTYLLREYG